MGVSSREQRSAFFVLVLAAVLLAAGGARALSIQDTKPIFFIGGGEFGFSQATIDGAGLGVAATANSNSVLLSAGNAIFTPALSIQQNLQTPFQNPQAAYQDPAGGCKAGDVCQTPANPFIADSSWTLRNDSGSDLPDLFLFFTRVVTTAYPDLPVALDGNLVEVLRYQDLTSGQSYLFAMLRIGPLAQGQIANFSVRYIVGGDMPFSGNQQVMPPLGVYGLVPEPGTVLLLASGLLALAMAKRSQA